MPGLTSDIHAVSLHLEVEVSERRGAIAVPELCAEGVGLHVAQSHGDCERSIDLHIQTIISSTTTLSAIAQQPFSTSLVTPIKTRPCEPMPAEWTSSEIYLSLIRA